LESHLCDLANLDDGERLREARRVLQVLEAVS
jgi:hypothetical protein